MHTRVPASAGLLLPLHLLTACWDHQEFRSYNIIDLNMSVETPGFCRIHLHHFVRGRFLLCAGWHVWLSSGDNDVKVIDCMRVPRQANVPLAGACHWQETNAHLRLMDGEIKCSKLLSLFAFDTISTITLIRHWDPNFTYMLIGDSTEDPFGLNCRR